MCGLHINVQKKVMWIGKKKKKSKSQLAYVGEWNGLTVRLRLLDLNCSVSLHRMKLLNCYPIIETK